MEFRRDQFRVDPTIAIDTAFKIAEEYGRQSEGGESDANTTTLPDRQEVAYDVFLDEDEVDHFEFQEKSESECTLLSKQHKRYRMTDWDELDTEVYGKPPFPDRRLFIKYGGSPYITFKIYFDKPASRYGANRDSRSRSFVPRSHPGDVSMYHRLTREQLKEWLYEFLPNDPARIRSQDDIQFTTGGRGHEMLKEQLVTYLDELPDVEVNRPEGHLTTLEEIENWDLEVTQRCVFQPSYVAGLLNISYWYAVDLCEELVSEDWNPVVSLDPPVERHAGYPFVIAHEKHWGDSEEYDHSTWKFEG